MFDRTPGAAGEDELEVGDLTLIGKGVGNP